MAPRRQPVAEAELLGRDARFWRDVAARHRDAHRARIHRFVHRMAQAGKDGLLGPVLLHQRLGWDPYAVLPLVVASTLLFVIGIAFCYFFVFNTVFHFINQIAPKSISVAPDIENYLNFVLTMFLAFGLTFETPIVVVMLTRMGLVTIEQLREARPYFIVIAFVVAAVVTPPDVVSQLLLAVPMCLLFEVGLIAARFVPKRAAEGSDGYSPPTDA